MVLYYRAPQTQAVAQFQSWISQNRTVEVVGKHMHIPIPMSNGWAQAHVLHLHKRWV